MQNTAFSTNKTLNIAGRLVSLEVPRIMSILNVTPDSFYDGGKHMTDAAIVTAAENAASNGATFIDVGGYSTRPGADDVPEEEELRRVLPAIRLIRENFPGLVVSIDTFRARVARAAVETGAVMINDVSGGTLDPEMFRTAAELNVPYVLMHMKGNPKTMSSLGRYENVTREVLLHLQERVQQLVSLGVKDVIIDPGFGFAKDRQQNFELLNRLEMLQMIDRPVLVGLSRKSLVWKTLEIKPEEAANGSTVLHTVALLKGANILRTHDVREARETIALLQNLHGAGREKDDAGSSNFDKFRNG